MPCTPSPPRTVSVPSANSTVAPISLSSARNRSPGWSVTVGQSGTVTWPPVTTAAIRNGAALDRSGSIVTSRAATGPGATIQIPAVESSTSTPRSRRACTVIAMCGSDGTGPAPTWRRCRPLSQRAPQSSRPDTNCDDADE